MNHRIMEKGRPRGLQNLFIWSDDIFFPFHRLRKQSPKKKGRKKNRSRNQEYERRQIFKSALHENRSKSGIILLSPDFTTILPDNSDSQIKEKDRFRPGAITYSTQVQSSRARQWGKTTFAPKRFPASLHFTTHNSQDVNVCEYIFGGFHTEQKWRSSQVCVPEVSDPEISEVKDIRQP